MLDDSHDNHPASDVRYNRILHAGLACRGEGFWSGSEGVSLVVGGERRLK